MDTIIIHTGLDHFMLVDAVTRVEDDTIEGWYEFKAAEPFLFIEALAQLGALHVRFLNSFERHAFLLSLPHITLNFHHRLDGLFSLYGKRISGGANACEYNLEGRGPGGMSLTGNFRFAVVPYDPPFDAELLKNHYRKVFTCLLAAAKNV